FEARTLQHVPAEYAAHNDLEIPATNSLAMLALDCDEFSAPGFISLADNGLIQSITDIRARVALQSAQQIRPGDHISPRGMRSAFAVLVMHAAQIRGRALAPERLNIR